MQPHVASPFDVGLPTALRATGALTQGSAVTNSSPFDVAEATRRPLAPPPDTVHSDKTVYFVITSNTKENVVKSVRHGLWATQRKNEHKLDEAFRCAPAVVLCFSVNGSEAFQGYARMRSPIGRAKSSPGKDPFNGFGRLFDVEWLRLHDLMYREVEHLRNPLNGDRSVRFSRDGQELTNLCGQALCRLIDRHVEDPTSFAPPRPQSPQRMLMGAMGGPFVNGSPHSMPGMRPPGYPPFSGAPYGVPPHMQPPATARQDSGSSSSSSDDDRRRKRRRRFRPLHPLTVSLDEQVEYFASLSYEEYVQWWSMYGTVCLGPTPPPGTLPPGHAQPLLPQPPPPRPKPQQPPPLQQLQLPPPWAPQRGPVKQENGLVKQENGPVKQEHKKEEPDSPTFGGDAWEEGLRQADATQVPARGLPVD